MTTTSHEYSHATMRVPKSAQAPLSLAEPRAQIGGRFALATIVTVIGVSLISIAANEMYDFTLRAQVHERRLAPPSNQLRVVQAEAQAKLSRYQWVRQKDGVLRIPVSTARTLVIARYAAPAASANLDRSGAR